MLNQEEQAYFEQEMAAQSRTRQPRQPVQSHGSKPAEAPARRGLGGLRGFIPYELVPSHTYMLERERAETLSIERVHSVRSSPKTGVCPNIHT